MAARTSGPERPSGWSSDRRLCHDGGTIDVRRKSRRWRRRLRFALLVAALALLPVLPEWALRSGTVYELARAPLLAAVESACGVQVELDRVEAGVVGTWVRLAGLRVRTSTGTPLLAVESAELDLSMAHLLSGAVFVRTARVVGPQAWVRVEDGVWKDRPRCFGAPGARAEAGLRRPLPAIAVGQASLFDGRLRLDVDDTRAAVLDLDVDLRDTRAGLRLSVDTAEVELTASGATSWRGLGPRALVWIEGPINRPTGIRLERLELESPALSLAGSGRLDPAMTYRGRLTARADLGQLEAHLPRAPSLAGKVTLTATVAGSGTDPHAYAALEADRVVIGKRHLGRQTRVEVRADRTGLDVNRVRVDLGRRGGRAEVTGRLDFAPGLPIRAEARAEAFSFARLLDAIGTKGVWVDFAGTGTSQVEGTLQPFRLEGPFDFRLTGVDVWQGPWSRAERRRRMLHTVPTRVQGQWVFTKNALDIRGARVRGAESRGVASAFIHHQSPKYLRVSADFARLDLAELGPVAGLELEGRGPLIGKLGGPFERITAEGSLDFKGLKVGAYPLGAAQAKIAWNGKKNFDLDDVRGRLGSVGWTGDVGIRFAGDVPVSLRARLLGGRLGDLLIPLDIGVGTRRAVQGRVSGRVELDGPIPRWSGPVRLDVRRFRAGGLTFPEGRLRASLDEGRVRVRRLELRRGAGEPPVVRAHGEVDVAGRSLVLSSTVSALGLGEIEPLAAAAPSLQGVVDGALRLSGPWTAPSGEGRVEVRRVRSGEQPLGGVRGEVRLRDGLARVRAAAPAARVAVDGEVRLDRRLTYTASVVATESDLPTRLGWALGVDVEGTASARARLRGALLEPEQSEGDALIRALELKGLGIRMSLTEPRKVELRDGHLELDRVVLAGPMLRARVSGRAGRGELDLDLGGTLDLAILPEWLRSVERASGRLRFEGSLGRGKAGLVLVGRGRLEGGAVEIQGLRNRFSGIEGPLSFSQSGVVAEALSGRWAGGALRVSGSVDLEGFALGRFALRASVSGARPRIGLGLAELSGRLDGEVELGGVWPKLEVRGAADVRGARVTPRTDVADLVGSRRLAAAYDPRAEILDVDLALGLVDGVTVKNDDLDVELEGQLRLTGTNERVGLLGSLSLKPGGRVSFVGREYETEGGIIELRGRTRIEPRYDLTLSTSACDARILVELEGGLEEFTTRYASSPEMNPEDIASCIVRGVRRRDLDQDLASFAGSALLKLSGVERQVKRVLPIDQLDVTTEFSHRSRTYEPRVLVAKELTLLGRSLRLEYSTSLLRNEDQRAAVRVRLTPQLSLRLGWAASEDVPLGDWGLDLERRWTWGGDRQE